jgi:YVTN family beta-propeller protein
MNHRCRVGVLAMGLWLAAGQRVHAQQAVGATFGDVIQLQGGTPSDIVLDELRHQLYLVSNTTSQVLVLDYTTNQVVAKIPTGRTPLAGTMSMDGNFLYVTASGPPSALYAIDLTANRVAYSQTLPSTPQGVETGIDGRVLVAMAGTGVTAGVPQKTLQVFDPVARTLTDVAVPALTTTLAPIPAQATGRPVTTFPGKLLRTPDGSFIIGVITPTNASTYIFVYEVASGVILRNRTTAGQSTVIAMAPDGSRFMAGFTMYDTATLAVVAQQNNANAPFTFSSAFNTTQNVGGSIFSPDGATLYSAFNTAATSNPPSPSLSSTLLVNDPVNLGIRLGIKLPESIVAKIAMTSDGADAWGLSDSGLVHMPLGKLFDYPILVPETTQVFLAMDDCNRGVASGTLKINNLGKGRLTYTVAASPSAALVYSQSSGLAPSTVTFTMEPGRSGVVRQPGTNIWTGAGTQNGTPINLTLSSPDAINIPNTIRIFMNYRQSDQRGVIYPVPTTQNNSASGTTGNTSGNEGLQDILLDEARGLVYLTNSGLNRIEVFDTQKQHFVNPIPAGQMPHQMAMGGDGKTLYVGNTGGESISIIDLDLGSVVDSVVFPPVQRSGTANPIYPRSLAMGYFGLQFVMSNGTLWKVVGNQALPRPADPNGLVPVSLTGCPNCGMIATQGNEFALTFSGNGTAYVYDATADAYVASRLLIPAPITGYYGLLGAGPGGAYFLVDGLIVNPSLTTIGGSATPGATGVTGGGAPGQPPVVSIINTGNRNVAALAPLDAKRFLRLTTPVRQNITTVTRDDARTTLEIVNLETGEDTLAGVVPENPVVNVFGTTRFNTNARMMAVNAAGTTAYMITLSGLSVVSLTPTGTDTRPAIDTGARGIVNSADGTPNFKAGSFITISGTHLADAATADTIPPPTVLGGSCVTFGDIAVPLLVSSSGQIQAQVPDTLPAGTHVVEVRSLSTAQASDPVVVTVKAGN